MKKVSVIIPCYNCGEYLEEAINSALASTYKNIEIVVANDGSTDEATLKALEKIGKLENPLVKVVHQENKGASAARNLAISHAIGEYILPLDGDDKIHPSYIEKALEALETMPNIGAVYCETEFFGTKSGKFDLPEYSRIELLNNNLIVCCGLYRKKDWERVGGYREDFQNGLEDWEFWISFLELGYDFYKIPEVLFYYRWGENAQTKKMNKKTNIETSRKILKHHAQLYADNHEHLPKFFNYIAQGFNKTILNTKFNKKWMLKISLEPRQCQ